VLIPNYSSALPSKHLFFEWSRGDSNPDRRRAKSEPYRRRRAAHTIGHRPNRASYKHKRVSKTARRIGGYGGSGSRPDDRPLLRPPHASFRAGDSKEFMSSARPPFPVEIFRYPLPPEPGRPGGTVVQSATKARRAPLGPAEGVPQWWRRARVRQRKTTLVTIPSNHPRIAVTMTIHTSDTVDEPTTQLNST
jgi:hypothetical protein